MSERAIPAEVKVEPAPEYAEVKAWAYTYDDRRVNLSVWWSDTSPPLDPRLSSADSRENTRAALITIRVPMSELRRLP